MVRLFNKMAENNGNHNLNPKHKFMLATLIYFSFFMNE